MASEDAAVEPVVTDPFTDITNADDDVLALYSEIFEIRASHPRQVEMRDRYFDEIDFKGGEVLEVGCGTGAVTAALAERDDTTRVVGIDPSPVFIEAARRRDTDATFEIGDALSLPFADDTLDVVVFHTVLCHVPEADLALREATRVVRPGGAVAVFDGDFCSTTLSLSPDDPLAPCATEYMASNCYDMWFMRTCRPRLEKAGLEVVSSLLHGFTDPEYFLPFAERAVDLHLELGRTTEEGAEALRAEVKRRYETGEFYGHMLYASHVAIKPTETDRARDGR